MVDILTAEEIAELATSRALRAEKQVLEYKLELVKANKGLTRLANRCKNLKESRDRHFKSALRSTDAYLVLASKYAQLIDEFRELRFRMDGLEK